MVEMKMVPLADTASLTFAEAEAASRLSEERFKNGDVEGLISKYDEDVVIRFASLPEMRGREKARQWLIQRLKRQKNYTLEKTVLAVDGQKVVRSWVGSWIDSYTCKNMEGRGIEVLEYRAGKLVIWDACFHVWEEGRRVEMEYFDAI